jgi:uncharacterized membrane protein YhaH (DUF805 family)
VKAIQQQRFHQQQLQMHKALQAVVVVLMQESVHRLLIVTLITVTVVTATICLEVCSNRTAENWVVEVINSSQHNSSRQQGD